MKKISVITLLTCACILLMAQSKRNDCISHPNLQSIFDTLPRVFKKDLTRDSMNSSSSSKTRDSMLENTKKKHSVLKKAVDSSQNQRIN